MKKRQKRYILYDSIISNVRKCRLINKQIVVASSGRVRREGLLRGDGGYMFLILTAVRGSSVCTHLKRY